MTPKETVLKNLLKKQHLQEYRAFLRAYDRVASRLDASLVGGGPSKATFYRWLSGQMGGLPYPGHCRVLEGLFPGRTADELFRSCIDSVSSRPVDADGAIVQSQATGNRRHMADLSAVFANRSDFVHELPPAALFDGATSIRSAGLSLNMLCQHYGDRALRTVLDTGCTVDLLFLRPRGSAIARREDEEGLTPGHLSALTELNIEIVERLRRGLPADSVGRLRIRTYDETIRFNITVVNDRRCVVQPYLPGLRGLDAPTFVIDRAFAATAGLYSVFTDVYESLWGSAAQR